jgi:ACR3 family arsenite efflux pump ArsB
MLRSLHEIQIAVRVIAAGRNWQLVIPLSISVPASSESRRESADR